ncbi:serine/threonine protein kinase [Nonomuraea deserti]|uniref:serine/threonine protein kinase n=1 Tax=Nonomuraea deserti TaxID=1848322 RepID=UPI0014053851|nr:serine/threonine-protein kinase [Nonomuraea deserti]
MTPEAIGPYRVVRQLGEGGQGVVYLGTAPDGTQVAIKVLREGVPGDGRFAKEIAAARRVEPFCIAQVLDASLGARPYIVTEYVEGPSLQRAGLHTGADLQRLAVATATALAAIHRAGVVHRDLKPANVLLGRDGPRVIDFGIARAVDAAVTRTSSIVGTPAYMAPEQFLGAVAGPAADVFAWGSVIVYAAAGAPPFGNDSLPAVLRRIQYDEPNLGDVPEPLRSIVYGCLAKDPAARPAMQDVLFQLISGRPQARAAAPDDRHFPGSGPVPPHDGPLISPSHGDPSHPGGPSHAPYPGDPAQAPYAGGPSQPPYPGGSPQTPNLGGPVQAPFPGGPPVAPSPVGGRGWPSPEGPHGRTGPTRPVSRNRLGIALLAGATTLVVTGGLAAAWVWLPTPPGDDGATTATVAAPSSPTGSRTVAGKKQSPRPLDPSAVRRTGKKTPKPTRTRTRPTPEPTRTTSKPSARPTTAAPTRTRKAGGVTSVSFDYEGIRMGGCWRYDMNIWAKVSATGSYSYRWLLNGQSQGAKVGNASSKPLLPSIVWKKEGTYSVVFEVIEPARSRKSATVDICDFDEGW